MRISCIDIGTNTILLLVADTDNEKITGVVHDEQVIARLGKGVDEHHVINKETTHRAADFLKVYAETIRRLNSEKIIAVGTSALRDATNKAEFCKFIASETGIEVEIISGDEEAEWTYRGAIGDDVAQANSYTVLDIGGGSTEIISGTASDITQKRSLDIGCVRMTERYLRTSPPMSLEVAEAQRFIRTQLKSADLGPVGNSKVIGVAGTVTTLAAIHLQLSTYDPKIVQGHVLSYDEIRQVFNHLRIKTLEEIRSIPQISHGRGDIILAGTLILLEFMDAAGLEELIVSDRGLRYGIILREIGRRKKNH